MNEAHVKEVFSDEAFVKDLFASQSLEVAQKKLLEKDIDLTIEDLKRMIEFIQKHPDGQLSEKELEGISGGSEVLSIVLTASAVVSTVTTLGVAITK